MCHVVIDPADTAQSVQCVGQLRADTAQSVQCVGHSPVYLQLCGMWLLTLLILHRTCNVWDSSVLILHRTCNVWDSSVLILHRACNVWDSLSVFAVVWHVVTDRSHTAWLFVAYCTLAISGSPSDLKLHGLFRVLPFLLCPLLSFLQFHFFFRLIPLCVSQTPCPVFEITDTGHKDAQSETYSIRQSDPPMSLGPHVQRNSLEEMFSTPWPHSTYYGAEEKDGRNKPIDKDTAMTPANK